MIRLKVILFLAIAATMATLAQVVADDSPKSFYPDPSWDFGYLVQKSEVSHTFYLLNGGSAPLKVVTTEVDCSCASSSKVKEPIPPGDSAAITITFRSGRYHGHVAKSVKVTTNDPERSIQRLRIQSEVIKGDDPTDSLVVTPLKLKWKLDGSRLDLTSDTISVANSGSDQFKVRLLNYPAQLVNSIDFPKNLGAHESLAFILKPADGKFSADLKGLSATFRFEGKDTTTITIPIELED
jgi:hypothetical protein